MPEVKIKHIVSFSSEEQPQKAENLLSGDACRKWNCAPAEKQASVVFQLEKSTKVSSVDIGNDGSAFIEVLVGRSSSDNAQFQVLLVASSFMSPQESRQGQSPNRVRIFDKDKLAPEISSQKWDLVKVVCTQPFNKRASYGLSFIKLHTLSCDAEDVTTEVASLSSKKNESETQRKTFGGFMLKEESNSQTSAFHPGMLMQMVKEGKDKIDVDNLPSTKSADEVKTSREKRKETGRSRSPVAKEIEEKRRKVYHNPSKKLGPTMSKAAAIKFDTLKQKKAKVASKSNCATNLDTKKKLTGRCKATKSYDQILKGVVFVISGFQNPLRSEIRGKALQMGAQYRKDWTQDSTHLLCAFPHTPKYRQVSLLGGKIVRKEWIDDCSSTRQLLPWRKYSMDHDQSSGSSSEEEEEKTEKQASTSSSGRAEETSLNAGSVAAVVEQKEDDPYGGSTDEEGGDTEDEIEKIQAQRGRPGEFASDDRAEDPYDANTDEDIQQKNGGDDDFPALPSFFNDKIFLLYGSLTMHSRRLLKRLIVACGGKISEYMNYGVGYVVTDQIWDDSFDQALSSSAGLVFVKPAWIYRCGTEEKIVPYQPYVVPYS